MGILVQFMIGIVITTPGCQPVYMYNIESVSWFLDQIDNVIQWLHNHIRSIPVLLQLGGSVLSCELGCTTKHDLQQKILCCWYEHRCWLLRWCSKFQITRQSQFMARYHLGWHMMSAFMNCRPICQHEQWNKVVSVFLIYINNLGKILQECPIEPLYRSI